MSMQDLVADMLSRIRNGYASKLLNVTARHSNQNIGLLQELKEEGYISGFEVVQKNKIPQISIKLKYSVTGEPAIKRIKRVSKAGRRVYSSIGDLKRGYNHGLGVYILTTPKGVISDKKARALHVGGEIMCEVF